MHSASSVTLSAAHEDNMFNGVHAYWKKQCIWVASHGEGSWTKREGRLGFNVRPQVFPSRSLATMSLNRLSSFRPKTVFMNSIAESPNALWVVFRDGYPLTDRNHQDAIVKLPTSSIRYLLGTEPIFGHSLTEGVVDKTRVRSLSASRIRGPAVVFLGWDESEAAITSGTYTKPKSASDLDGKFYLALSVDKIPRSQLSQIMEPSFQFCEARKAATTQNPFDMYILATARSMLDWNNRMKVSFERDSFKLLHSMPSLQFCPSCGTASHSTWSGWRRCCSSLLPGVDNMGRESCPSE